MEFERCVVDSRFHCKAGVLATLCVASSPPLAGPLYRPSLLLVPSSSPTVSFPMELPLSPKSSGLDWVLLGNQATDICPLAEVSQGWRAIVRPSSSVGQTLHWLTPQSSDANGSDQALAPGQGWTENRNGTVGKKPQSPDIQCFQRSHLGLKSQMAQIWVWVKKLQLLHKLVSHILEDNGGW